MAQSDSELIKRTLEGDENAFGFFNGKIQGGCSRPYLPQNPGLSHCRRHYARHLPQGISEIINAETPRSFSGLVVRDCSAVLHLLAQRKSAVNPIS